MKRLKNIYTIAFFTIIISNYSIGQSTLTVANGGKMKIGSGTSVQNENLNIGSGSQLVNRGDLTVTGVLENNAGTPGLIIKADANGYGSLLHNNTGVMAQVEQYLSSERWHLISSPVVSASVEAYWDIYLKDWTEQSSSWYYIVDPNVWPTLYPTEGYAVWADDDLTGSTTVTLDGELINGDAGYYYLSYTPTASQFGWNLVGNPYPSSVEWNTDWFIWQLSGWALFYDNGIYSGWNPWLPVGEQSFNGKTDGWMAPNQGFWVRAIDSDPYLISPQSARALHPVPFLKSNQTSDVQSLHLKVTANNYSDETTILFLENGTEGSDGLYELGKMFNITDAPNLYTSLSSGEKLSVNVLPENWIDETEQSSIPIGFESGTEMSCSLTASGLNSFEPSIPVLLEDLKEHIIHNLRDNPTYTFFAAPEDDPNRFILHFMTPNAINLNKNYIFADIYTYHSDLYVLLPINSTGISTVFNTAGQIVKSFPVCGPVTKKTIEHGGIYVVRVLTENQVKTTKVKIQ